MIITDLIREQILGVTVMFGAGIAVAVLYQIFTVLRGWLVRSRIAFVLLEIMFWAAAALIAARFLYYCSFGKISVHTMCAFAAGAILWKMCFYDIIYKICTFLETKWDLDKEHGKEETKQSI